MTMMMAYMPGIPGETGRRVVEPGSLRSPVALMRAQVTSRATALGPDDAAWVEYAANEARFSGTAGHLLIEGQQTNLTANPRGDGAVVAGAQPTGWGTAGSGVTATVVAIGTLLGLPSVTIRYQAASAPLTITQFFGPVMAVSATPHVASFISRLAGGTLTNVPGQSVAITSDGAVAYSLADTAMRQVYFRTLTGTTGRRTTATFTCTTGQPVDFAVEWAAPSLTQGATAGTPVLPSVGTPAASTRGADMVSPPLASLGITGPCTILWRGMVPQAAPSGNDQMLFQLDSGVDTNRFAVLVPLGSVAVRTRHPASVLSTDNGTMTPGTPFAVGLAMDGAGNAAVLHSGGSVQTASDVPVDLTTLRLGNNASGTAPMFGEVQRLRVLPFALTHPQLAAALAGLG